MKNRWLVNARKVVRFQRGYQKQSSEEGQTRQCNVQKKRHNNIMFHTDYKITRTSLNTGIEL
jgi:hypothetical protein